MKRWILVLVLLLSVGLNIGLLAQRGREQQGRQARREARLERLRNDPGGASRGARERPMLERLVGRLVEEVGVTGEQRDRFVAIQENFFHATVAKRERLRQHQRALRENISSPQPDRALAEAQVAEIAATQKEIEAAFLDNYFATIAILDQDQRERYSRVIAELRRFRPWERRGRLRDDKPSEERRHRRAKPAEQDADQPASEG